MPTYPNGPTPTVAVAGGGLTFVSPNPGEAIFGRMDITAIGLYTGTATITAAAILSGLISYTGSGHTLTTPTGTQLDAAMPNAIDGSFVEFGVNATTNTATLDGGVGVTDNASGAGSLLVTAASSARFRLVKTGTAAWNLYRVG